MHNSLIYELTVFGGAGAAGVLAAFLYDLFRLKRRLIKTGAIVIHIEDVLYWIIATVIIFLASYVVSSGETRFYFVFHAVEQAGAQGPFSADQASGLAGCGGHQAIEARLSGACRQD